MLTLLRSADPERVADWARDYGATYPILDDVGQWGDVGIELSETGATPVPNLVGRGGVLLRHKHDPTPAEIEAALAQ